MTGKFLRAALMLSAAMVSFGSVATAQDNTAEEGPVASEKVVVFGTKYRNRSNETAPVLDYGLDYFQKFEPLTAGDALKRVPSVAFLSDVLEYDGVRLRGLDPGYTQILINGEKVPGSGVDRSFFVDRIPAELIERVEIVRSSSADRSGDALAGAVNIKLRDSYSLDGGYIKGGLLHFDDGEIKPVVGGVYSGAIGDGRFLVGGNVQGRHNPKFKQSLRFEPNAGVFDFDNREDQTDVRDGYDYSANGSLIFPAGGGEIKFTGAYVRTDRTETEHSREYDDLTSVAIADLNETSDQLEEILQENYSLGASFIAPMFGGETRAKLGFAAFVEDIVNTELVDEYNGGVVDEKAIEQETTDTKDREYSGALSHTFLWSASKLKVGIDVQDKVRDAEVLSDDDDCNAPCTPALGTLDPVDGGVYKINEERVDSYAKFNGQAGRFDYELGLRLEMTDVLVTDENGRVDADYAFLLPSAHVKYKATDNDRFRLSYANTVRRPSFDFLAPAVLEEELGEDDDFRGNPRLEPERGWGIDASYERRLGGRGVAGINVFYRGVSNKVELASTGVVSSSGNGFIYTPRNVGDGFVYGVEVDFSTPLWFAGLEDTGVFLNFSWLDSEVTDVVTGEKRRFNDQAEYVFNTGFIQELSDWAASFGATYRLQGDAFNSLFDRTIATSYGADLEVFIEKRFGESFVIRLTGTNLLNASKDETFFKWDNLTDRLSGDINDVDEFELETEESGPAFQIVGRYAF
ncbi:MAG TPA: TonB-dependent receptor [Alphaproteobacteria bacterium]|nr:TonB-dependent receptor [Alphaproteobacteria bacterium]HAJ47615.1 TonB-dependent receptor [Alphaproteobacteria bacterium]